MVTILHLFNCNNRFLKLVIFPNHIKVCHLDNVPTFILNFYKIRISINNIIYFIIILYIFLIFLILISMNLFIDDIKKILFF